MEVNKELAATVTGVLHFRSESGGGPLLLELSSEGMELEELMASVISGVVQYQEDLRRDAHDHV